MRVFLKLLFMFFWMLLMMALTSIPWLLQWESARRKMVMLTLKVLNKAISLHVKVRGELSAHRPLMLVSNHSSYLDIFVMGESLPISFTPKKEIASWPVIGFCCKLAGCVFVERTPKAIAHTKEQIAARMKGGRVMCIFAEGTTNNGTQLKPFRSSFFSLAEGGAVGIQPAIVRYTHRDGVPLDAAGRAEIAWYDDMSLVPHLLQILSFKRIDAELVLLPALEQTGDRKALCAESERVITLALE